MWFHRHLLVAREHGMSWFCKIGGVAGTHSPFSVKLERTHLWTVGAGGGLQVIH